MRMPEIKKNIDALIAEETRIDTECAQKLNDIKHSETILATLDRRGIELDQQIVDENEYDDYLRDIEKANKELASLNQAVEHSKTSNMITCRAIDEMEQILKEILALVQSTDVDELEETVYVVCLAFYQGLFITKIILNSYISVVLKRNWSNYKMKLVQSKRKSKISPIMRHSSWLNANLWKWS